LRALELDLGWGQVKDLKRLPLPMNHLRGHQDLKEAGHPEPTGAIRILTG